MSNKKRFQFLTLFFGSLVVLLAFAYTRGFWQNNEMELSEEERKSLYVEEDPAKENQQGRLLYEYEMLADPATGEIPLNIRKRELVFANENLVPAVNQPGRNGFAQTATEGTEGTENSSFVSYGPYNLGGRTRALAMDVDDENILLAGGVSGGIWRSTDAGQSWNKTLSPLEFPAVTTLVQDERSGHTTDWYFAGGEFFGNSASAPQAFYYGDGIFRSTDSGLTWSPIAATEVGNNVSFGVYSVISKMAIDNSNTEDGTEIYVAGVSQIIRTTQPDFSDATTVLGGGNAGINVADVLVSPTGRVFAAIANSDSNGGSPSEGVFTSPDGINWADITPPTIPGTYARVELALDPNDETQLYAIGAEVAGGVTDFLFHYNVTTDTWTDLSDNMDSSSDVGEGHNMQQGYNLYVKVHPGDGNTVFIAGTNILRSTNGFASNNATQIGGYQPDDDPSSFSSYINHHPDQHAAAFLPSDPNVMLTGTDGGVFRTEDNLEDRSGPNPVAWTSLNNGYVTTQFYAIDYLRDARGDRRVPGGMQDNGSYINYTQELDGDWTRELGGDGSYSAISYNALYLSAQEGQIRKYDPVEGTNEFGQIRSIEPSNDRSEFIFINPFIVNPVHQDQLFVGGAGEVYYTDDIRENPGAGEWETFTASGMAGERISTFGASIQPAGVLYIGTRNGSIYRVDDTSDITSANDITDSEMVGGATVSSIAVDPQDADRAVATFSNYGLISIWLTEDGGNTWESISGNLEENPDGSGSGPSVRSAAFLPDGNGGRMLFVGTSVGLFMTSNLNGDDTVWEMQSENQVGKNIVNMIKVRPNEGQVMAATHGNGIFVGNYEVVNTPTINYSWVTANEEALLRGPTSLIEGQGFSYQWLKDGEAIEGETNPTLSVTDAGTYKLRLTDEIDQTVTESNELIFTIDGTSPVIESIFRLDPVQEVVAVSEVTFQVSFDEQVQEVDEFDFEVTGDVFGDIASITQIQTNQVFDVVVNNLTGEGTLGLGVVSSTDIVDLVGNPFEGTISNAETYTITGQDELAAITRFDPMEEVTGETSLTFRVTFSGPVNDVDQTDFELSAENIGTASIQSITSLSDGAEYNVLVNITDVQGTGTLGLVFTSFNFITFQSGAVFPGSTSVEESYIISDLTAPSATIARQNPEEELTEETRLTFEVTFSEEVVNVDATDFELSTASVTSAAVETVSAGSSANSYLVVVDGATRGGLIDLDIASNTDIVDLVGDAFNGTITSEETYTIDNITSIDDPNAGPAQVTLKQNPTEGVFHITLSESYVRGFELKVMDSNGKQVLIDSRNTYEVGSELELDLRQWPDGLYLLNVAGQQRKEVVKLLKQSN